MASGFSGGYSDFSISGSMNTRSVNDPRRPYMSNLAGMDSDVSSQVFNRRPEPTGKRSLSEFQQHFQQQQQLALYLRNVKQRASYQQNASPISPLSPPVDFYGHSQSPDISSLSSNSAYRIPIFQQLRQHQQQQQQRQQHQHVNNDNANLRSRSFLRRDWWFRGVAAGWEPTKQRRRGGFAPKRLRRESKRRFRKDKD